jgi:hypothetical protein
VIRPCAPNSFALLFSLAEKALFLRGLRAPSLSIGGGRVPWGGGYVSVYHSDQRWENGYRKVGGAWACSGAGGPEMSTSRGPFVHFGG